MEFFLHSFYHSDEYSRFTLWDLKKLDKYLNQNQKFYHFWKTLEEQDKKFVGMLFVLYNEGGVYCNGYTRKKIDVIFENYSIFFVKDEQQTVSTNVFGCRKKHPLFLFLLDQIPLFKSDVIPTRHRFIESMMILHPTLFSKITVFSSDFLSYRGYFKIENGISYNPPKIIKEFKDEKTVMITILARNKAHCLPLFLDCILNLEYDKSKITLYIHTNNNKDNTEEILDKFYSEYKDTYQSILFIKENFDELEDDATESHNWRTNQTKVKLLADIREKSIKKSIELGLNYYFSVDCDNFILPYTLSHLINTRKAIVAPLLHCIGMKELSNFFLSDKPVFFKQDSKYKFYVNRELRGIFCVPIVHCTYLIDLSCVKDINSFYLPLEEEMEFLQFIKNTKEKNHFITNEKYFGIFFHFWNLEEEQKLMKEHLPLLNYLLNLMIQNESCESINHVISLFCKK